MGLINTFQKKIRRIGLSFLFRISHLIKNDRLFLIIAYYLWTGRRLNIDSPKRFTEKIQWLKINSVKPEFSKYVDKYEAKLIVSKLLGEKYIIPTIGCYNSVEEIPFEELPNQFVIKSTNGGGGNNVIICKNKKTLDLDYVRQKMIYSLVHNNNGVDNFRERQYSNVIPRIIVEKYMQNGDDCELSDYKIYCFNGRAEYCQVIANRHSGETIDFFDRHWNHMPFCGLNVKCKNAHESQEKPNNYSEMLTIADELSKGFDFIRIDLYNINGDIYFGEFTFFPGSGFGSFTPDIWDYKLGDLLDLKI